MLDSTYRGRVGSTLAMMALKRTCFSGYCPVPAINLSTMWKDLDKLQEALAVRMDLEQDYDRRKAGN
jgi:hypothetical protein